VRYHHLILGLVVNVAGLLSAGAALADIPPPGLCHEKAGEMCDEPVDKDGEAVSGEGICVAEQCSRATPDGPMTYACVMCRAAPEEPRLPGSGGAAGEPGEPSEPTEPAGGKAGSPTQSQAGSAGTSKGGSGSAGQAGNASAGTAATTKPSSEDDGGCNIGRSRGSTAALSGAALLLLGLVYRRRRGSAA